MKKAKKIVAIAIALAVAISCFAGMSVSAKVITRSYFNCDKLPRVMPTDGSTIALDTEIKSEGTGSLKVTVTDDNNFDFQLECPVFDASNYEYLYFDIYLETGDTLKIGDLYYQFNVKDSQRARDVSLASGAKLMYHHSMAAGTWHTIAIPVSDLDELGVDLEHVTKFRLLNYSGLGGWDKATIATGRSFWIDNIRFGMEAGEKLISSCNTAVDGAWSDAVATTEAASEGDKSIKVTLNGDGNFEFIQYFSSVDISEYEYLCFDIKSDIPEILAKTSNLRLRLNNSDKEYDLTNDVRYTNHSLATVTDWVTFSIPTASLSIAEFDLSAVDRFIMLNQGVWGTQQNCSFYIDNIRATHEKADWVMSGEGFSCNGGYLTQELDNTLASFGTSSTKFHFNDNSNGYFQMYYGFDTIGYNVSDYKYLKFDVYASNGEIFAKRNKIYIRLSNDGDLWEGPLCDVSEYFIYMGNAFESNKWHTFCIPTSVIKEKSSINLEKVRGFVLEDNHYGAWDGVDFVGETVNIDNIRFSMTDANGTCEHGENDKVVLGGKGASIFENGESGETWCYVTGEKLSDNVLYRAFGDVNADDEVNLLDIVRLKKFSAKSEGITIAEGTGNIDGNETVADANDITALKIAILNYELPDYYKNDNE